MTQISGISTTETALSNVAYLEGERPDGSSVKIPPNLIRPSGTSFPGSPSTDSKFYRTDRNIEYYYDGARWLSTTQYSASVAAAQRVINGPYSASQNPVAYWRNPHDQDIYIEKVRHAAALSGTGNWTLGVYDSVSTAIATITITASDFSSTTVNATSTNYNIIRIQITENSGTATVEYFPSFTYRLVG